MGTPFRVAIAEPLEKLLNMIYRPKDLTPQQANDAFNRGLITETDRNRTFREAGYTDELMAVLIEQQNAKVSLSLLKDMLLTGRKTETVVRTELKATGLTPNRINSTIDIWKRDRYDKILNRWAEECIDSYEKGLITEAKLRAALMAAGWEDVELGKPIDLQVQVSNLVREQTGKAEKGKFTKAELRALYIDNLITRSRAQAELEVMNYSDEDAHLLILNWAGTKGKAGAEITDLWSKLSEWFGF